MAGAISLRVPNAAESPPLVEAFVEAVVRLAGFRSEDAEAVTRAAGELARFALEHAYPPGADGELAVEVHLFDGGIRIDVHDWGLPFELERHRAPGLELPAPELAGLVDEVGFRSLGRDGKLFTIVKYAPHAAPTAPLPLFSGVHDEEEGHTPAEGLAERLVVRSFADGDEEGIAQLVYRNYANTYVHDLFYSPEALLERCRAGEIVSTVAELDGRVVGHHAFVPSRGSPVAETGVAVVDPELKGLGVFNRMSEHTLRCAEEHGLKAVYGQAVTFHPYSQKTELAHGYRESALLLGAISGRVRIERNELTAAGRRGAAVVSYRLFDTRRRQVYVPEAYREQVERTYDNCGLGLRRRSAPGQVHAASAVLAELNAESNTGVVAVNRWEAGDDARFHHALRNLLAKHCDMVYADVNLETVANVDEAVEALNAERFFYGGVLFLRRAGHDCLRLQLKNSLDVEEEGVVCYSEFCSALKAFVLDDQARVGGAIEDVT